nr:MAG TPA: helix-turn-helix domain protein [Caudoviricetes sp.]
MDRLRQLREAAGLTQIQLALRVGVTQGTLANWERGARLPQLENLVRISNILGCGIDELLGLGAAQEPAPGPEYTITAEEGRING